MADKLINKRKRKLWIILGTIALILVALIVACAIYLGDYYHADMDAIEAFELADAVQMQTLDNGNILFAPENATQGFIFYPGGKVEHKAYIPLMQALAEKGMLCVLVKMPFRLAVLDVNAADGVQEQYPQIGEWYIGGHSLGGSMAASYLAKHTDEFKGLVLLGAYSTVDLSDSGLAVLSVYGSEDKVMNREKYADNQKNLPDNFTEAVIDGGCHAYFGMYGPQDGDGTPAITNAAQIIRTSDLIFEILNKENASEKGEGTGSGASFTKQCFRTGDSIINYWLYIPENPKENLPLIVYLHGGSGKGEELELITSVDGFPQYIQDNKITPNAYILIPQLSSGCKGWIDIKEDLMKLLHAFADEYVIDKKRISLTGHSMGGTGVWQLALAYPNSFSAIAPMSGSVKVTDINVDKLKNMRVWAFVGENDRIVDPSSSVNYVEALSKINANANITVLSEMDHFTVPAAYLSEEYDLIQWLIGQ